jgi:hypothetical protein
VQDLAKWAGGEYRVAGRPEDALPDEDHEDES